MNIEAYRKLHQGLGLFLQKDMNREERRTCEFLRADLEQAVYDRIPLDQRSPLGFYCPALLQDSRLSRLLGKSLDQGHSPFFLNFSKGKIFRFIAEFLPQIGVCVKDWQNHLIHIPYWDELIMENRRHLQTASEPELGYALVLGSLMELFKGRRSVSWRNGSTLAADMEEYIRRDTGTDPVTREFCEEAAGLLLHPEDLVLQAIASPKAWIRRVALEYLQRQPRTSHVR